MKKLIKLAALLSAVAMLTVPTFASTVEEDGVSAHARIRKPSTGFPRY